MKTEILTHQGQ